jgi:pimeloyl-ACP methyl ester carboxylesterase
MATVLAFLMLVAPDAARALEKWQTLPTPPPLPPAERSGYAPVNGIEMYYAVYGKGAGAPLLLIPIGMAAADMWAALIPTLAQRHTVVVADTRGHGRSTRTAESYSYDLLSADYLALLDYLRIEKVALVGASDGAIIGLDIAIHHPERLTKLFAFAANSDPSGVADIAQSTVFNAYIARAEKEYRLLSPTPDQYKSFFDQISKMWGAEPHFTAEQLLGITVPTWIVDADHDEAIKRENIEFMASEIPNAGLLLQPQVSHFSFLQDPRQFTSDVLHFLEHVKGQ